MRLTRRRFLGGAAAVALSGAGVYELVDRLTPAPQRPAGGPPGLSPEQHVFDLATVESEGVEVLVPPLHSEVVTSKLKVSDLAGARHRIGYLRPGENVGTAGLGDGNVARRMPASAIANASSWKPVTLSPSPSTPTRAADMGSITVKTPAGSS